MVLEGLKKFIGGRRDPFDVRGLEQFTPDQQERILGKIGAKEAEILERKADIVTRKRLEDIEKRSGLGAKKRIGLKEKLSSIKEFRQGNLRRQAERSRKFKENERMFREGKLPVKPVGPTPSDPKTMKKLEIKPIKLKAPSKSLI